MAIFQVQTELTGMTGGPYLNTLFFDSAGGTAQQAADAAALFWASADDAIVNDLNWRVDGTVDTLNEVTGALVTSAGVTGDTGTGASTGPLAAPTTQGLVRLLTGDIANGRRVRGRIFVPGMSTANMTDGRPSSIIVAAMQTAVDNLIAHVSSTLVVWHRPTLGAGGSQHEVTSGTVWDQFAVLRSRRD